MRYMLIVRSTPGAQAAMAEQNIDFDETIATMGRYPRSRRPPPGQREYRAAQTIRQARHDGPFIKSGTRSSLVA
jgi:hypothetical protein